jgi:4,5-dihydroxyphthalate decarboxylase
MLRSGAVDAVVVDPVPADERFVPVVPDPEATCRAWQQRHGAQTLNHVVVVRESIAGDDGIMRELLRLFRESRDRGGAAVDRTATPVGLEANRRNLEVAIAAAAAQRLLARPLTVENLVSGGNFAESSVLR